MQDPGAGTIAQFALTHSVEEELEEPGGTGQRSEEIVVKQRFFEVSEIAVSLVFEVQDGGPDQVGGESSPKDDHENDVVLEEKFSLVWIGHFPGFVGHDGHRLSGFDAKIEKGAQDTGNHCNDQSFH